MFFHESDCVNLDYIDTERGLSNKYTSTVMINFNTALRFRYIHPN